MKREHRLSGRRPGEVARVNEAVRKLDKAMELSGVPESDKQPFLEWVIKELWDKFKEERMEKRLRIENEIRQLGIRFPNGTVKEDYSVSFSLPSEKISNVLLEGVEEIGLLFTQEENGQYLLMGRPSKAGDYILRLRYDTSVGEPTSELIIPVAFNPNPRDLWRDIPTDRNIPYYKEDSELDYIKVESGPDGLPKKDVVAASRRGRSHAQEGKARDDHYGICHCKDSDWYILAVADGAGSAKYSRKGSEAACGAVVEHCRNRLLDNAAFESAIREYASDRENKEKRTEVTRHIIEIIYKGAMKAHEAVKKVARAN
ncbi:MAG: protein phosphatase 2C domain-containing protein, partial [Muribaculaceae bacterium]|nr:protein phosphatase 2C domain-containing protein [Muribaculaceae bacterium]